MSFNWNTPPGSEGGSAELPDNPSFNSVTTGDLRVTGSAQINNLRMDVLSTDILSVDDHIITDSLAAKSVRSSSLSIGTDTAAGTLTYSGGTLSTEEVSNFVTDSVQAKSVKADEELRIGGSATEYGGYITYSTANKQFETANKFQMASAEIGVGSVTNLTVTNQLEGSMVQAKSVTSEEATVANYKVDLQSASSGSINVKPTGSNGEIHFYTSHSSWNNTYIVSLGAYHHILGATISEDGLTNKYTFYVDTDGTTYADKLLGATVIGETSIEAPTVYVGSASKGSLTYTTATDAIHTPNSIETEKNAAVGSTLTVGTEVKAPRLTATSGSNSISWTNNSGVWNTAANILLTGSASILQANSVNITAVNPTGGGTGTLAIGSSGASQTGNVNIYRPTNIGSPSYPKVLTVYGTTNTDQLSVNGDTHISGNLVVEGSVGGSVTLVPEVWEPPYTDSVATTSAPYPVIPVYSKDSLGSRALSGTANALWEYGNMNRYTPTINLVSNTAISGAVMYGNNFLLSTATSSASSGVTTGLYRSQATNLSFGSQFTSTTTSPAVRGYGYRITSYKDYGFSVAPNGQLFRYPPNSNTQLSGTIPDDWGSSVYPVAISVGGPEDKIIVIASDGRLYRSLYPWSSSSQNKLVDPIALGASGTPVSMRILGNTAVLGYYQATTNLGVYIVKLSAGTSSSWAQLLGKVPAPMDRVNMVHVYRGLFVVYGAAEAGYTYPTRAGRDYIFVSPNGYNWYRLPVPESPDSGGIWFPCSNSDGDGYTGPKLSLMLQSQTYRGYTSFTVDTITTDGLLKIYSYPAVSLDVA